MHLETPYEKWLVASILPHEMHISALRLSMHAFQAAHLLLQRKDYVKSEQFALHIEFEAPAGHLLVGSHAHDDMHACVAAQASHFVFLLPAFNFLLPLFLVISRNGRRSHPAVPIHP